MVRLILLLVFVSNLAYAKKCVDVNDPKWWKCMNNIPKICPKEKGLKCRIIEMNNCNSKSLKKC